MDRTLRARARHRTDATELLRDLTMTTAVVGIAATAGLGWLASMTYAGTTTTTPATDVSTVGDPVAPAANDPAQNPVATPRPRAITGGSSSGGVVGGSSGISGTRRHGHVSTGSS
jgi:hypothetical protein